ALACLHPFARLRALALWAVPVAAAVVRDGGIAAGRVLAARDMPAESRSAAARDRAHHLQLIEADVAAVGVTPRRPTVAEDVRDLQRWTRHGAVTPAVGPCGSSRVSAARDDRAGS